MDVQWSHHVLPHSDDICAAIHLITHNLKMSMLHGSAHGMHTPSLSQCGEAPPESQGLKRGHAIYTRGALETVDRHQLHVTPGKN